MKSSGTSIPSRRLNLSRSSNECGIAAFGRRSQRVRRSAAASGARGRSRGAARGGTGSRSSCRGDPTTECDVARRVRSLARRSLASRFHCRRIRPAGATFTRHARMASVRGCSIAPRRCCVGVAGAWRVAAERRHAGDVSPAGSAHACALRYRRQSSGRNMGERRGAHGALALQALELSLARAQSEQRRLCARGRQTGCRQRAAGRAFHV